MAKEQPKFLAVLPWLHLAKEIRVVHVGFCNLMWSAMTVSLPRQDSGGKSGARVL